MSSADFWARKLGQNRTEGLGYPKRTAGLATAAQPLAEYATDKAPSQRMTDRCPACNSTNYGPIAKQFTARGMVETWRCFGCGYPVQQQFSGMTSISNAPVAGHARQISHDGGGLVSNYQPKNTAAGRVS